MTTPFDIKLIEQLNTSPCDAGEETRRALGQVKDIFRQILLTPFMMHDREDGGQPQRDAATFPEVHLADTRLFPAGILWGVCDGGVRRQPTAANKWIGVLVGRPCANKNGDHSSVRTEVFYLRGVPGASYNIPDRAVFPYAFDPSGDRIVLLGAAGAEQEDTKQLWAKLTSVGGGTASAQLCDNASGDNPGAAITVILPQRDGHGTAIDSGAVVGVNLMTDDTYACTSDYSAATYHVNGGVVATSGKVDFDDTSSLTWTAGVSGGKVEYSAEVQFPPHPTFTAEFVRAAFTADKPSTSASASVTEYWGAEYAINNPGSPVTIFDFGAFYPRALDGAKTLAHFDRIGMGYEVVQSQQMVLKVKGTIPAMNGGRGLLSGNATFTVDAGDLKAMTFSPFNQMPVNDSEAGVTIHNTLGMSVAEGSVFYAEWCEGDTQWDMTQAAARCEDPPPPEEPAP